MFWNAGSGEVILGNTQMNYVRFGRGNRALIVLPGLSDGLAAVKGKALLLAKPYVPFLDRYTVYMFSRKNDMPKSYSMRDMANDQAKAIAFLGKEKICVMGVSQGGMIAQYLAIDHPELVEKLVLAVTASRINNRMRECVKQWTSFAKQGDHKKLMIDTAEKSYSPDYLKKYRKLYPIIGLIGKPLSYDRFFINTNAILEFDAYNELNKISCPTLIIGGETDKTVGVQASYEMNRQIAGSKLYIYPKLGHAVYEEAKDFYQRVFAFLDGQ